MSLIVEYSCVQMFFIVSGDFFLDTFVCSEDYFEYLQINVLFV